jgi:hypothetical protein
MYSNTKKHWFGIFKILTIKHLAKDGNVLSCQSNIYNTIHQEGEKFILGVCFAGTALPTSYYLGLDARHTIKPGDTIADLIEPVGHGYQRQALSNDEFTLSQQTGGIWMAESPSVIFTATQNWITVANVFITNGTNLMATAELNTPITLNAGESASVQIGMTLRHSLV